MVATVVEDERQLDGSRHLEIIGDSDDAAAALRLVISRDGDLQEAELSLELEGDYAVIGFEPDFGTVKGEVLDMDLQSHYGRAVIRQREDGDLDLALTICDAPERDE